MKKQFIWGVMSLALLSSPVFANDCSNTVEIYSGDFNMVDFFNEVENGDFALNSNASNREVSRLVSIYNFANECRYRSTTSYIERRVREIKDRSEGHELLEALVVERAINERSQNVDFNGIYDDIIRRNSHGLAEEALRVHAPSHQTLNYALRTNPNVQDEVMSILENGNYPSSSETQVLQTMIQVHPDSMSDILNSRDELGLTQQQKNDVLQTAIQNIGRADEDAIRQVVREIMNSGASEAEILAQLTAIYNSLPQQGIGSIIGLGDVHDGYVGVGQEISTITEAITEKYEQIMALLNQRREKEQEINALETEYANLERQLEEIRRRMAQIDQALPYAEDELVAINADIEAISNTDIIKELGYSNESEDERGRRSYIR